MEEKRLVAEWLLEYACYHRMTSVLHVCSKHYMTNESEETSKNLSAEILASKSGVVPARYMLATLKTIVVKDKAGDYEMALQLLEQLFASTTSHIPFKIFSKCETGLKILTLFHHLQVKSKRVIPLLNQYFPKQGCLHPETPKHSRTKMAESQKGFRTFFLPLATKVDERQKYIDESLEKDFGSAFLNVLKKHIGDFVSLIEKLLPRPVLLKFVDEPEVLKKLKSLNSPSLTTLVDGLEGKAELAEHDVLLLLTSVLHKPREYRKEGRTSPSPDIILIESPTSEKESAQNKVRSLESPSGVTNEQLATAILLHEKYSPLSDVTPTTLTIIPLQTPTKCKGTSASLSDSPNKKLYISTSTEAKLSTPHSPMRNSPEQHSAGKIGITSDEDILSPSPQHLRTGTKLISLSRPSVLSLRENSSPEKMQPSPGKKPESPKKGHSISSEEQSISSGDLSLCDKTGQANSSTNMASPSKKLESDSKQMDSPTKGRTSLETSPRKEPSKQVESFAERLRTLSLKMACSVKLHDIANNKPVSPRKTPTSPKKTVASDTNEVESGSPVVSPDKRSVTSDNRRESPHKVWSSPRKEQSSPSKRSTDEVLSVAPLSLLKTSSHSTPIGDVSPGKQQLIPSKGHDCPNKRVSWSDEVIEIPSPEPANPSKVLASPPQRRASPSKVIKLSSPEPVSPGKTRSSSTPIPSTRLASPRKVLASPSKELPSPNKVPASPSKQLPSANIVPVSPSKQLPSPSEVLASPSKRLASPNKVLTSPSKRLKSPSKVLASPNEGLSSPDRKLIDPVNRHEMREDQSHSPLKSSGELFVTSDESDRSRELSSPDKYPASPRKRYRQGDKGLVSPDINICSPADEMESPRKRQKRQDANTTFGSPSTSSSNEGFSSAAQVLSSSVCSAKSGGPDSDDEWHSCVDEADSQKSNDDIDIQRLPVSNSYTDDVHPGIVPSSNSFERETVQRLIHEVNNEFTQWCENALRGIQSSVDVPTFIEFLQDVELADEVHDYVRSYLGEGKETEEFATQFLEHRSKFKNHLKQDQAE